MYKYEVVLILVRDLTKENRHEQPYGYIQEHIAYKKIVQQFAEVSDVEECPCE